MSVVEHSYTKNITASPNRFMFRETNMLSQNNSMAESKRFHSPLLQTRSGTNGTIGGTGRYFAFDAPLGGSIHSLPTLSTNRIHSGLSKLDYVYE